MLDDTIKDYMDRSVLCWLATQNKGQPSVSPKEIFTYYGDHNIIIANIASQHSVQNINACNNVCVSFIDIFAQKGFQTYGKAKILSSTQADDNFEEKHAILQKLAGDNFKVLSVIDLIVEKIKPILAPSYRINSDMDESQMIENGLKTYGVRRI